MKKNKSSTHFPLRSLVIGGSMVGVVLIAIVALRPKTLVAPTTNTTDSSAISITTADGVDLAATYRRPDGVTEVPALILLHDYGQDRHQWDPYIQKFLDVGYAVLSYDLRGFGDSRLSVIPKDQPAHLRMLPDDLPAVLQFLQQQLDIDQTNIMLIGAGVGANVAFVASGSLTEIHRAVLLSPSASLGALDGLGIKNFLPKNILGVAGTTEMKDLRVIMAKVSAPKEEYEVDGGSRGILLLSNEQTLAHIISWLQS